MRWHPDSSCMSIRFWVRSITSVERFLVMTQDTSYTLLLARFSVVLGEDLDGRLLALRHLHVELTLVDLCLELVEGPVVVLGLFDRYATRCHRRIVHRRAVAR